MFIASQTIIQCFADALKNQKRWGAAFHNDLTSIAPTPFHVAEILEGKFQMSVLLEHAR